MVRYKLSPRLRSVPIYLITTETVIGLAAPATRAGARVLSMLKHRSMRHKFAIAFPDVEAARTHPR